MVEVIVYISADIMFLERHIYIYDTRKRFINLQSLFENGPGWKSVSDWEEDPSTGYLRCSAGWMAFYNQYYVALLGSELVLGRSIAQRNPDPKVQSFDPNLTPMKPDVLLWNNMGETWENGVIKSNPLLKIPIWHGPLPSPPILPPCVII